MMPYLSHLWVIGVDHFGEQNNNQQRQNHHHNLEKQRAQSVISYWCNPILHFLPY